MTDLEALNLLIATGDKVTSARLDYLQETLGVNKLFLSKEFNQLKQGLRYLRDSGFDPSTADLSEFLNESADPFLRESDNKKTQIFSLTRDWSTPTIDRVYYISFNNNLVEFRPVGINNTVFGSIIGRNAGMFVAPYNCKIAKVICIMRNTGSFTGKLGVGSGKIASSLGIEMTNRIVHLDDVIVSSGFVTNEYVFPIVDGFTINEGEIVCPSLFFSAQAQSTKSGVTIQIQIKEI
jgi:hypothetical protein